MSLPEFWHFPGEHEAADLELYSPLSKCWFLVKGLGLLAEVWTLQVNLSPHKTLAEVQGEVRIHRGLSFRLKSLLQTKENTQQNRVWCLFKEGGHLMPWPAHLAQAVDGKHLAHTPVQK